MFSEALAQAIDGAAREASHVGFLAREVSGRHALLVADDAQGPRSTLPVVELLASERPSDALERCVHTQLGLLPRAVFPLPGPWRHEGRCTFVFAGLSAVEGNGPHEKTGASVRWSGRDEAWRHLATTPREAERRRDLYLLSQASAMALSTERRLLLMVRELHRMGFECLRFQMTRSPVDRSVSFALALPTGAAPVAAFPHTPLPVHAGTQAAAPFGWGDACFDTPEALALKVLRRAPGALFGAWGVDRAWTRWFDEALTSTEPEGLLMMAPDTKTPVTVARHRSVSSVVQPP